MVSVITGDVICTQRQEEEEFLDISYRIRTTVILFQVKTVDLLLILLKLQKYSLENIPECKT